jgi:hypothetical protein
MATINIPDEELFSQLEAKALAEGKTVDEFALDTLRASLREKRWQAMFSIDRSPTMSESDIVDAVHDYRAGR